MAAVVGVFVVATAAPAFAHDEALSGQTVCSNGDHLVTWSIGNRNTPLPMLVVTATATLNGGQQFAVAGAVGSAVPSEADIPATTTVPGNLTGDLVLDVLGRWSDGHQVEQPTFSLSLGGQCSTGPTTTTTEATTSTTEAPTSTTEAPTTTTEATTSTTVESSTTVPTSTTVTSTPIDTEGSTVQTTTTTAKSGALGSTSTTTPTGVTAAAVTPSATSGALPFTGSTDSGPIIGLSSLVAGAFALVFAKRRHSTV